ncbi:hypothetical protein GCK72_007593 [Caenorhabditis remanei]|uniref:SCP domain-containing protein n=1 Tax=Caenorhabditis remanei TaxID=31234 RepID=A0A6A5HLZ6_CAERE|nr:hypothetical protein GCK72_007593 [Caenorhabditis remanei]KAF1767634.1 hypothetical protein GCK72_007593 [Caenorhabditis remanei]
MNLIQSLLVFLSFVAIKDVSSESTIENFIGDLNSLRQEYVDDYKVPNMHELIWSEDLVNILTPLDLSAKLPKSRINWRFTSLKSYNTAWSDIEKYANNFLKKTPKEVTKAIEAGRYYTMDKMELFNPLQRFIGCTSKPEEDIIESVNQIREEYSKKFNVPNVHQLIWSEDLLKILKDMDRDNGFKGACVTWRYVHIDTSNKGSIKNELSTFFKKSDVEKRLFVRNNSDSTLDSLEFLNPLQKFIACSRNSNTHRFICLLGTEGKFTMFDYSHKSNEIPGSNCQKRYKNDSGVCVAINSEEESYFGRQSDFMSDINQIRRRYAKEYRVPNMHALTWSNELAEVLEPLRMDDVKAQAKKTWRYGALNTYDNTIYHIKADVTRFFEMNRTAKNDHIVKTLSDKDTMDRLEFLNPLQKTIACGRKEEEGVTYIICLLGPKVNFTTFDTSFQSQLAAGSKCHKGYYNEDGLCVVQIPTQEPIIDYRKMAEEERNKALTEESEPEPILENHGNGISLSHLFVFLLANLIFNI